MSSTSEPSAGALFPAEARATLTGGLQGATVATPSDNDDILAFIEAKRMDLDAGALAVNYRRSPDYFAFLAMQGSRYVVYLQRDEEGEVKGLGSFSYLDRYVGGERVPVGYVGDLRIAPYRRGQVQWRKQYALHLAAARGAGARLHFTAILDDNAAARRALVDEASKKNAYEYRPLFRYVMVNAIASLPVASPLARHAARIAAALRAGSPARGIVARRARASDEAGVRAFLQATRGPGRLFGEDYLGAGWDFRVRAWEGFRPEDFLLATSSSGEILGACLPWAPRRAKSVVVERFPAGLRALRTVVNAASGGRARIPAEGERLEFLYLTHLAFVPGLDPLLEAWCLAEFLRHARDRARREGYHLVTFHEAASGTLRERLALLGEVTQVVPATLYDVRERGATYEDPVRLDPRGEPCFEMALI